MINRRTALGVMSAWTAAPFGFARDAKPLFSIGLIADVQFADVPAAGSRFYRESLGKFGAAIEQFNKQDLAFCIHLGDFIDRKWESFEEVIKVQAGSRHRFHHLLGNHDFDVLDALKPKVPSRMGLERRYSHRDHGGFRFVFLDTTDVSTYSRESSDPGTALAQKALDKARAQKLEQAQPWNGALGADQLAWLDQTCKQAGELNLKVLLFAHHPIYPDNSHNAWNSQEVLTLIDRHPHIVGWLNGHNHAGHFGQRKAIPFITLKGMVETRDTTAFAVASFFPDRVVLKGEGRELSREWSFPRI